MISYEPCQRIWWLPGDGIKVRQSQLNHIVIHMTQGSSDLQCRGETAVIAFAMHQRLHILDGHLLEKLAAECRLNLVLPIAQHIPRVLPVSKPHQALLYLPMQKVERSKNIKQRAVISIDTGRGGQCCGQSAQAEVLNGSPVCESIKVSPRGLIVKAVAEAEHICYFW